MCWSRARCCWRRERKSCSTGRSCGSSGARATTAARSCGSRESRIATARSGCAGARCWSTRTEAPELGPDEWWAEDLEGCSVRDRGRPVGTVRRLLALPSVDVLEVERPAGADLLVPLVADAVREVDTDRREIEVDLRFLGED